MVSSTLVRDMIANGQSNVSEYIDERIYNYIKLNNVYTRELDC